MTILWCGGEDIDFPNGVLSLSPQYGANDTAYSRFGLFKSQQTSGFIKGKQFSGITSGWFHCTVHKVSTYVTNALFGLAQLSDNKGIFVGTPVNHSKVSLRTYDGASWNTLTSEAGTSIIATSARYILDIYFSGLGSSETVKVYVDGTEVINFSGDVSVSGMTSLDCMYLAGYSPIFGTMYYFSECIVADQNTRLMRLKTLAPNAAGDANEWDSGSYTDIDEDTASDTDTISTEGIGDNFQCNLTGMPAGSTQKPRAVKLIVSAADDSEQMGLKLGVKTNSVVHLGTAHSLTGSWTSYEKMYQNNPETASAFTSGEIDALQLALRTDSTTTTTV